MIMSRLCIVVAICSLALSGCGKSETARDTPINTVKPLPVLSELPEDTLAVWGVGEGTIANAAGERGAAVASKVFATASDKGPVRLAIPACPGSTIIVAAGGTVSLHEEKSKTEKVLVVQIESGAIQLDVKNKGSYDKVVVRGAALEVEMVGTLINAERVSAQKDFVLLVHGRVKVRLKREIAKALAALEKQDIELTDRQSLTGSTTGGLGSIATASSRPQLAGSSKSRTPLEEQSESTPAESTEAAETSEAAADVGESTAAGNWEVDVAGAELDNSLLELFDVKEPEAPETEVAKVETETETEAIKPDVEIAETEIMKTELEFDSAIEEEFVNEISESIEQETIVNELDQEDAIEEITDDVVEQTVLPLGDFPNPPAR